MVWKFSGQNKPIKITSTVDIHDNCTLGLGWLVTVHFLVQIFTINIAPVTNYVEFVTTTQCSISHCSISHCSISHCRSAGWCSSSRQSSASACSPLRPQVTGSAGVSVLSSHQRRTLTGIRSRKVHLNIYNHNTYFFSSFLRARGSWPANWPPGSPRVSQIILLQTQLVLKQSRRFFNSSSH